MFILRIFKYEWYIQTNGERTETIKLQLNELVRTVKDDIYDVTMSSLSLEEKYKLASKVEEKIEASVIEMEAIETTEDKGIKRRSGLS